MLLADDDNDDYEEDIEMYRKEESLYRLTIYGRVE